MDEGFDKFYFKDFHKLKPLITQTSKRSDTHFKFKFTYQIYCTKIIIVIERFDLILRKLNASYHIFIFDKKGITLY